MRALLIITAVIAAIGLASPAAGATADPPDVLLKALTSEIQATIRRDKDIHGGDPAKIAPLIEAKILPFLDFSRMTKIAMAQYWRLATPEQQKTLTGEFQTLLVRTFAAVLEANRDRTVEFKAVDAAPGDMDVTVRSLVQEAGVDPLPIDYDLGRTPAGWKIYEIRLDGMNLIANYRSAFATRVRDVGVDGLIKALRDKNRESDTRANTD